MLRQSSPPISDTRGVLATLPLFIRNYRRRSLTGSNKEPSCAALGKLRLSAKLRQVQSASRDLIAGFMAKRAGASDIGTVRCSDEIAFASAGPEPMEEEQ